MSAPIPRPLFDAPYPYNPAVISSGSLATQARQPTGGASSPSSPPRKFLIEVRRRGWLVVLSALLVVAVAWGVGQALTPSSSAEAVLVVQADGPLADQPDASAKLAATYATLIPLDSRIQAAVERKFGDRPGSSFEASNDPNTAVLRLNFSAEHSREAVNGARYLARALGGASPVSPSIAPDSIAIARLPQSASSSETPTQIIVVAAFLGILLGLVLVAFWRAHDARIDSLGELRQQLPCPCFEIDLGTMAGLHTLFDALVDRAPGTTAIVPSSSGQEATANSLWQSLNSTLEPGRLVRTAVPGSEHAGELEAAAADATILVVAPGARTVDVAEAVDILGRYQASPTFAVLARGKRVAPAAKEEALTLSPQPKG